LPQEFVPLAEETGLIVALGQHVLEESCRKARAWQDWDPDRAPAIHVNLSAVELADPELTRTVGAALDSASLEPSSLVLEITESLIKDADAHAPALHELRAMGVRLALDDFGTGYSALSYLRTLPLDILKIAKPFVEGMARGSQENSFVRMIIDLARALDLRVVAEGIESATELEALRDLECELGQGFFLAVPLDLTSDPTLPALRDSRHALS
jgi:EAL domain-containing protein (putative c-di-GMP-specific phosphodiesterase class I)